MINGLSEQNKGQDSLASLLMQRYFQDYFNAIKCSLSVQKDINKNHLDSYQKESFYAFVNGLKWNNIQAKFDTIISVNERDTIFDVVHKFMMGDIKSPQEAARRLAYSLKQATHPE